MDGSRLVLWIGVLACSAHTLGCDVQHAPPSACAGLQAQPLYFGSPDPEQLALDEGDRASIGMVASEAQSAVCTGTVVRRGWVLTAEHCDLDTALTFTPSAAGAGPLQVVSSVLHETRKLALLELEPSPAAGALVPIPLSTSPIHSTWVGTEVTLAGVGQTETGTFGALEFLVEPIVAFDESSITVDGMGESGACGGDSGGPLLIATDDGSPRVIGVLDRGSSDCLGIDIYVRVDGIEAWLADVTGVTDTASAACGAAP